MFSLKWKSDTMKYSIVTTLYKSEEYIEEFIDRIESEILRNNITNYEIICVDDGYSDNAFQIALSKARTNSSIKLIRLSRNFGHYKALMTGLSYSSGDEIFLIDSDLEEEPELLSDFISCKHENQCDVVYGVQEKRKGKWFERVSGKVFYKVANFLCDGVIVENAVTARLMSRKYVDELVKYKETNLMIFGLFSLVGFEQIPLKIRKNSSSETTYTLTKKLSLAMDNIANFSTFPLRMISKMGFMISFISFLYFIMLVFNYFLDDEVPLGWSSLIASVWLLGGIILMSIGIIGAYISRIFLEVKNRPLTIIRDIVNFDK